MSKSKSTTERPGHASRVHATRLRAENARLRARAEELKKMDDEWMTAQETMAKAYLALDKMAAQLRAENAELRARVAELESNAARKHETAQCPACTTIFDLE
jgi:hypothetical protein